jgi:hypothetical protein
MKSESEEWLPLDIAAERLGYAHKESLSRRLRQLRKRGKVRDIGRPPVPYRDTRHGADAEIVIMWPNPKTALLCNDAPSSLLRSSRGRPTKSKPK